MAKHKNTWQQAQAKTKSMYWFVLLRYFLLWVILGFTLVWIVAGYHLIKGKFFSSKNKSVFGVIQEEKEMWQASLAEIDRHSKRVGS